MISNEKFFDILKDIKNIDLNDYDQLSVFHTEGMSVSHVLCHLDYLDDINIEARLLYNEKFGYACQQDERYFLKSKDRLFKELESSDDEEEVYILSKLVKITPFKDFDSFKNYADNHGLSKLKSVIKLTKDNDKYNKKVESISEYMVFFKKADDTKGYNYGVEEVTGVYASLKDDIIAAVHYDDKYKFLDYYFKEDEYHEEGDFTGVYFNGKYIELDTQNTIGYIESAVFEEVTSEYSNEDIYKLLDELEDYANYDGYTLDLVTAEEYIRNRIDELKEEEEN